MSRFSSIPRPPVPFRALVLYALFLGAAWSALRLTGGTHLGVLLGPIAAQIAMAGVVVFGSRTLLRDTPSPARLVARRQLSAMPLVLVGVGGFLFQASILTGARMLNVAGGGGPDDAHIAWGVLAVSSVVGAPILEELFFRGMLQPVLSRRNVVGGLVLTAALFGVAHGFQVPLRAVPAFLQGLVLGGLVLVTGRLRAAVVVHALNNALVLTVAVLMVLSPGSLPLGGAEPWTALSTGVGALGLVVLGFMLLAREPGLASPPPPLTAG